MNLEHSHVDTYLGIPSVPRIGASKISTSVQLFHFIPFHLLVVIIMTRTINILVAFKITRKIAIQPLSGRLPFTGHHWNLDFGGQNFPIRYVSTFSSFTFKGRSKENVKF